VAAVVIRSGGGRKRVRWRWLEVEMMKPVEEKVLELSSSWWMPVVS
jgi:hypothetical protein